MSFIQEVPKNQQTKSSPISNMIQIQQNIEIHQWLQDDDLQNKALTDQYSELQILKVDKNQQRIKHILSVLKKYKYDTLQWVDLGQIELLLTDILNRHFPDDILAVLQQETPRFIGNRIRISDFVDTWVITEYSLELRILRFRQKVDAFENNLIEIKKKHSTAKKQERLNEFGIDFDSSVTINILEAYGMPKGRYSVKVQVADKNQETEVSDVGSNPKFGVQFQFPVWSPHSHVIIQLFQHYPPYDSHELGSLQLPLNNFKDQIPYNDDYVLEEKSGVLGDTRRRLKLQIWWVHSQYALLEDEIARSQVNRKDINEIKVRMNKMQKQVSVMYETFHESKVTVEDLNNQASTQNNTIQGPTDCEKFFLDHSHHVTTCFGFKDDSVKSWQELVFLSSLIITVLNVFVLFSRPTFLQSTLILVIGMLIWSHVGEFHHTTKFIRQICIGIIFSVICDCFWLRTNINDWRADYQTYDKFDKQIITNDWVNLMGIIGTILGIILDSFFILLTYILTLKYEYGL